MVESGHLQGWIKPIDNWFKGTGGCVIVTHNIQQIVFNADIHKGRKPSLSLDQVVKTDVEVQVACPPFSLNGGCSWNESVSLHGGLNGLFPCPAGGPAMQLTPAPECARNSTLQFHCLVLLFSFSSFSIDFQPNLVYLFIITQLMRTTVMLRMFKTKNWRKKWYHCFSRNSRMEMLLSRKVEKLKKKRLSRDFKQTRWWDVLK